MTGTCPACGAPKAASADRDRLFVADDPPSAYWGGVRLPVTTTEARVLGRLARNGAASHSALERVAVGPDADPETLKTVICKLRRKIRHTGIAIPNERGWGYRMSLPEETTS